MFLVKNPMDYGRFLPIWNKIQNLETVSGSFRPWVVSVGSFRPEPFRQFFFVVSALIGGPFRLISEVGRFVKSMLVVV